MSILSKLTGVHINPLKGQARLRRPDPIGAVKDVAQNPLGTIAAIAGGLAIPGIGGALGNVLGAIPGASALAGAAKAIPGAATAAKALGLSGSGTNTVASAIPDEAFGLGGGNGFWGSVGDLAGDAVDFLRGNHGMNALGVAQGVNTAMQQQKANQLAKQALGAVTGSYNERAPLRAQGLQYMQQANVGNPYATGRPNAPYGT